MQKSYLDLPIELKKLADHSDLSYDDKYDYIKDMDLFVKYEKEVRGLIGMHISSGIYGSSANPNELAHSFIKISYSPTINISDCTGVCL